MTEKWNDIPHGDQFMREQRNSYLVVLQAQHRKGHMDSYNKERKCIRIFREKRRNKCRSVRRDPTHTCGGCGGSG